MSNGLSFMVKLNINNWLLDKSVRPGKHEIENLLKTNYYKVSSIDKVYDVPLSYIDEFIKHGKEFTMVKATGISRVIVVCAENLNELYIHHRAWVKDNLELFYIKSSDLISLRSRAIDMLNIEKMFSKGSMYNNVTRYEMQAYNLIQDLALIKEKTKEHYYTTPWTDKYGNVVLEVEKDWKIVYDRLSSDLKYIINVTENFLGREKSGYDYRFIMVRGNGNGDETN